LKLNKIKSGSIFRSEVTGWEMLCMSSPGGFTFCTIPWEKGGIIIWERNDTNQIREFTKEQALIYLTDGFVFIETAAERWEKAWDHRG